MAQTQTPSAVEIPRERLHFRSLLLANPNYFGNVKQSPFKPVAEIAGNTTYEELACIGFGPQANQLNAIVYIKLPNGFGGGLCTNGSQEYVRFYASYDRGTTWTDLGLTSFTRVRCSGNARQAVCQARICRRLAVRSGSAAVFYRKSGAGARDPVVECAAAAERSRLHSGLGKPARYGG